MEIDSQREDPMDSCTQVEESSDGTLAVMTRSQKRREQKRRKSPKLKLKPTPRRKERQKVEPSL